MSTGFLFRHPGRLFNYMKIEQSASKEEILEKYAKGSYSTENTWPYDSPSAGYYDITNSTTRLILLNNQNIKSHLRGQVKPKRPPRVKDEYYDWVEIEYEEEQQKEIEKKLNPDRKTKQRSGSAKDRIPDPYRHFSHLGCSYKTEYTEESVLSSPKRGKSASTTSSRPTTGNVKKSEEEQTDPDLDLLHYLYYISKRKVGFQHQRSARKPPKEFRDSYNINHPEFTKGQKYYMNELCRTYSIKGLVKAKQQQYADVLKQRKSSGLHLNDDFSIYERYLKKERIIPHLQLNTGFISPRKLRPKRSKKPKDEYIERPFTAYPGKRTWISDANKDTNTELESSKVFGSTYAQTQSATNRSRSISRASNDTVRSSSSSSSSSDQMSADKKSKDLKTYSNVESEDSFISSSNNSLGKRRSRRSSSDSSISSSDTSSIPIDVNISMKEASDKSNATQDRPMAPLGQLNDASSQLIVNEKVVVGRSHRRLSSVSSGTSTIASSTGTITLNNDDITPSNQNKSINTSASSSRKKKTEIEYKKKSNNSTPASNISSNKNKQNNSYDSSSTVSSFSTSRSQTPVNNSNIQKNRAKSAKIRSTREGF